MRHETIFKRDNGDCVKINTSVYLDNYRSMNAVYRISVDVKPKGKKKWVNVHSSDDYEWRRLSTEKRYEYEMNIYLQHVSQDEIMEAKLELWQLLNPNKEQNHTR
jgi:hypothetical protein